MNCRRIRTAWVADITYIAIAIATGFVYLAPDPGSRWSSPRGLLCHEGSLYRL